MTSIDFYHGTSDKVQAACGLIGELHAQGRKVLVYAPAENLAERLDRQLCAQPATGFLPHCRVGAALPAETPVLIGGALADAAHHDVLINLDGDVPPAFSRFERLIWKSSARTRPTAGPRARASSSTATAAMPSRRTT